MVRKTSSHELPPFDAPGGLRAGLVEAVRECCRVASRAAARHRTADDVHEVHEARRVLKRARAVLRLMEDAGAPEARPLRQKMTRTARKFSAMRDATVVAKIAGKMAEKLRGRERAMMSELAAEKTPRATATWWAARRGELARIDRDLARLRPGLVSLDLEASLRRSLRRVRKQAKRARAGQTIEVAHEWRKRVIALHEQVRILRPLLGPEADELHARLKQLARRLGVATDYRVVLAAMKKWRSSDATGGAAAKLVALVGQKQKRALKRARKCWRKTKRVAAFRHVAHGALLSA